MIPPSPTTYPTVSLRKWISFNAAANDDPINFHWSPPSMVFMISPPEVTMKPESWLTKETALRSNPDGFSCNFQVCPELSDVNCVPFFPTIKILVLEAYLMHVRSSTVPRFRVFQFSPPLSVR